MESRRVKRAICAGIVALLMGTPIAVADTLITPGTVIFDMDTHLGYCDPDYWSFFGYPTVDFGATEFLSEDGHAAFTKGNWSWCDLTYGPSACKFLGSKHGDGRICCGQPLCGGLGSGVDDADLDLSLGTGLTMRVLLDLSDGGTAGVRLQFELVDSDGGSSADTVAVVPRELADGLEKPYVNRAPVLADDGLWHTITIWFDGLDWAYDKSAVAGTEGLDLEDIRGLKMIWRRGEDSAGPNTIVFDEITLTDETPVLWADDDADGDVDLADFARFQVCFGADPAVMTDCARMDANFDKAIDIDDLLNFGECHQGPAALTEYLPWCY